MQILMYYYYARCTLNLWSVIWFCCVFWIFSNIIDNHACLNWFISTKHSQILCPINLHILVCQHAQYDFFWEFSYSRSRYYMSETFTNCVLRRWDEKQSFVINYGYVSLVFCDFYTNLFFIYLWHAIKMVIILNFNYFTPKNCQPLVIIILIPKMSI